MSTRSYIGVLNKDGTVRGIYCHSDGYPTNNGAILTEHWRSITKIEKLLKLGDLSVLGKVIGEKHKFDEHGGPRGVPYGAPGTPKGKGWCLAYGRDRDEKGVEATTYESVEAFMASFLGPYSDIDWVYLFKSGRWEIYEPSTTSVEGPFTMSEAIRRQAVHYSESYQRQRQWLTQADEWAAREVLEAAEAIAS